MKTTLIIQARMGSTRLPGKSLIKINSKFLINLVTNRCLQVTGVDSIYFTDVNGLEFEVTCVPKIALYDRKYPS